MNLTRIETFELHNEKARLRRFFPRIRLRLKGTQLLHLIAHLNTK